MELHPTRSTFHVAVAGAGLLALGVAARLPAVVAFGSAMILAVAVGRAVALLTVMRLRAAGFEMVWTDATRVHRLARGGGIVVEAELRNRGADAIRAVALRPIASSLLDVGVAPKVLDLPAGARARVDLTVRGLRVGSWGVHGVALEVRGTLFGGEGLYEVPLIFANPLGIEVVPPSLAGLIASPRGGRARRASEVGRPVNLAGDGDELRELREHVAGDAFKRIAWKASARRGRLLVREMERDERAVAWLVVDASVELWAGEVGQAPLDRVMEDVAALATRLLRRGDLVGLVVAASRVRSWIPPDSGPVQAIAIAAALADAASCMDADRSDLSEAEVAQRVVEHARPLEARGLADVSRSDLDGLALRAEQLRHRAPFAVLAPFAETRREQALRHYLAAFGIESPPRADGERERAEATLAGVLQRLAESERRKKRAPSPSVVHVWAPAPSPSNMKAMPSAIGALRRRRIELRWTVPPFDAGIGIEKRDPLTGDEGPAASRQRRVALVVDEAVRLRARTTKVRAERLLRRLGVRVVPCGVRRLADPKMHNTVDEAPP